MGNVRVMGRLTMLAAFAALAPIALASGQQQRQMGGAGITVFKGNDFRGASATFQRDVANLAGTGFNDRINSLRIAPGDQWEVCADANFRGRCVVLSGSNNNLARNAWNNKISSMRRIRSAAGIIPPPVSTAGWNVSLFNLPNFRGPSTSFRGPIANLPGRSPTRSVSVGRGVWQLCSGPNFTGSCMTVSGNSPRLGGVVTGFPVRSLRPVVR